MTEAELWRIVEGAHQPNDDGCERQVAAIHDVLTGLAADDIVAFQGHVWRLHNRSYLSHLWGAAYLINGGSSDDGFEYFRGWLIAQGQVWFERALHDPDMLAELVVDNASDQLDFTCEDMLVVGVTVWCEKTGQDYAAFHALVEPAEPRPALGPFLWGDGRGGMDDAKGQAIYPRLWKKIMP